MLTIVGEHGSPLDGNDHLAIMRMRDAHQLQETLTGACEDDCEVTAPFIGVCPDETGFKNGAPIYLYTGVTGAEVKRFEADLETAMRLGFDYSYFTEVARYEHERGRDPYPVAV